MGAFSWLRAERTTQRKNIAVGDIYKILIPQEFGGGFIRDEYCGSGIVFGDDWDHMADLYGILASLKTIMFFLRSDRFQLTNI